MYKHTNTPDGELVIKNVQNKTITADSNISFLLRGDDELKTRWGIETYVKKINFPKNLIVHCDLVDIEKSLFNGKQTDILACFAKRGEPYETITYTSSEKNIFREVSSNKNISSICLSIKDENGNVIDFCKKDGQGNIMTSRMPNIIYEIELI